jgi:hypothetical protein
VIVVDQVLYLHPTHHDHGVAVPERAVGKHGRQAGGTEVADDAIVTVNAFEITL